MINAHNLRYGRAFEWYRGSCSSHQEHRREHIFICWSLYQARIVLHHLSLRYSLETVYVTPVWIKHKLWSPKQGATCWKFCQEAAFCRLGNVAGHSSELSPCPQLNRSAWRCRTGEIKFCSQRRVEYLNVPSSSNSGCYCFQGLIFHIFDIEERVF